MDIFKRITYAKEYSKGPDLIQFWFRQIPLRDHGDIKEETKKIQDIKFLFLKIIKYKQTSNLDPGVFVFSIGPISVNRHTVIIFKRTRQSFCATGKNIVSCDETC